MERAAVMGLGTMGSGIAQVLLQAGFTVSGMEEDAGRLESGKQKVLGGLAKAAEKGKLSAADLEAARGRFRTTTDVRAACEGADLVVEAIVEDMGAKQRLFAAAEKVISERAILATNTSSLSITQVGSALQKPGRCVGMHFFNPVPVMQLVEVVRGERTDDATVAAAKDLVKRLGKEAIVVRDSPGFASSRLGIILGLEAMRMVEEGVASPEDIDRAMELGYRHPMGPLKLTDLVGLDVRLAIADHLWREVGEQFRPPQILRRLVRAGKLGRKTGAGFYEYPPEK
ncbi:MAG: 3-hydroxyacyl-CoA dehydrogenase family protein [Deltaproteobacteria bacterium]|nr:3-hydroxyacyl-CoA dehydrogenase family protein [Deltaproteobacteria bacterium]